MKRSDMVEFLQDKIKWVDERPNYDERCTETFAEYILDLIEDAGMRAPFRTLTIKEVEIRKKRYKEDDVAIDRFWETTWGDENE